MPVSQETLDEIALSRAEYEAIVERLGREPSPLELGLFGALWSEHCGYKHSRPLLRLLPSASPRLLVAPGAENAGVVDIGDGRAVVMKIESHNHPSAVEPHEGAATGVGGIVRDVFAMGARPIALLNSLRFGPPDTARNRYLLHGVVGGIADYGNCIGIPNVGGEVAFAPEYSENPLVNAMCIGLVDADSVVSAAPRQAGDVILLVGADTGRDGIHGASGLASRTFEEQAEMRAAVQVGNPFLEKVLIEACLEAVRLDGVSGMQDLGAAGLTSAAIEAAARAGLGLRLDVGRVPRREEGMTPYEVMLSESQERMLLFVAPERVDEVRRVFAKWDLDATPLGAFVEGERVELYDGGEQLASTPVRTLTDPPAYQFSADKPAWLAELQQAGFEDLPMPEADATTVLLDLLASPNIASKLPVYRQYDHMVQTNTVVAPGADAAVLRVKGASNAIAATTDGNGRYTYLEPFAGGAIAVAEACRNLACAGAEPVALTDCLNFGNPERPDIQYQLARTVLGIKAACEAFGAPVVSGNVSLYNEAAGTAVYPTPVIGALGLLDDPSRVAAPGFQADGDVVALLGAGALNGDPNDLAGTEFLARVHGDVRGRPTIDLRLEARVHAVCRQAVREGVARSAHDCSDGGFAVALAECAIIGGRGVEIRAPHRGRWDAAMFGEAQSRIIIGVDPAKLERFAALAAEARVPWVRLGEVGGDRIRISGVVDVGLEQAAGAWRNGFERATSG